MSKICPLGGCNVIGQSEQCRSSLTQSLSGRVVRTQRLESEPTSHVDQTCSLNIILRPRRNTEGVWDPFSFLLTYYNYLKAEENWRGVTLTIVNINKQSFCQRGPHSKIGILYHSDI